MIKLSNYFSNEFLFVLDPLKIHHVDYAFPIFGAALVVLGLLVKILSNNASAPVTKLLLNRYYHLMVTIGLLLVLWFGFRYEQVLYFDLHIVPYSIILIGLIWWGFILSFQLRRYGAHRRQWEKEQVKNKYLRA